ncbi:hypothetical protein ACA910_006119 [Epithemia clementina (nom. ined.)]
MRLALAISVLLSQDSANAFVHLFGKQCFGELTAAATCNSRPTVLWGILDEIQSDAYDLSGSSKSNDDANLSDAYETFLAELVFSTNDPRIDIMNKFELAGDQEFIEWLDAKAQNSRDPEERIALRDLHEMIIDVKTRIEVNRLAEERSKQQAEASEQERLDAESAKADAGRAMSNAEVLQKAEMIAKGERGEKVEKAAKKSFYEQEITPEIRLSYDKLLKSLLPPYKAGETAETVVVNNYGQFDAQLVKLLDERSNNGDIAAKDLLSALAEEQRKRVAAATISLKAVLALREPMKMEGAIIKLGREGKIDEPFLLLLEANEGQARRAGQEAPAQLMARLRKRAMEEKDKQSASKEIRLIRQLLRTEEAADREKLLEEAFTPKEALIVPGTAENAMKALEGEAPEQTKPMPEVPPPDFINACKAVLLNFGNLGSDRDDRGDLASRIKRIAAEAEVVATRIYGKGMSLREQQDRAWKEQTTSIFDLERMEIEAERMGEIAPWANPDADDDMLIPGFDKDGRMKIGGS